MTKTIGRSGYNSFSKLPCFDMLQGLKLRITITKKVNYTGTGRPKGSNIRFAPLHVT